MSSADFCLPISANYFALSYSFNNKQTSRGYFQYPLEGCKTLNFPRVNAQFIKRIPIADGGLNGHVPTGPEYVTPNIGFLFIVPRFCLGLPPDITSR